MNRITVRDGKGTKDRAIDEDQRLDKQDKTLCQGTVITRQIDRAARLLGHDLTDLFQDRARETTLRNYEATEQDCKEDLDITVQYAVWQSLYETPADAELAGATLDNTWPLPATEPDTQNCENENCENEPAAPAEPDDRDRDVSYVHPDGRPIYLDHKAWRNQIYMRSRDDHADYFRRCFLTSQERCRTKMPKRTLVTGRWSPLPV